MVTDRLPKTPFLTKLDRQVYFTGIFILLLCTCSMVLKGMHRLGVAADIILLGEKYTFGAFCSGFALVVIHLFFGTLAARDVAASRADDGWRHREIKRDPRYYWIIEMWEGCLWSAPVDETGRILPARLLPGQTPLPPAGGGSVSNPLRSDR